MKSDPTGKDWPTRSLDQLVDDSRGITYGIVQPGDAVVDGVPIVRVNNIRNGRIMTDDVMRVARSIEAKYSRTRLRGGEILLTLVGSLGHCAIVPPELKGWNVARAVGVIPVRDDVDVRWVKYCLESAAVQHFVGSRATTTVQATLNLRDVNQLPIPLPPIAEQKRIVHILGTLDDKIELNRRMNSTLEAMARALFQSWFVDFDPVKAKAAGQTPAGMDKATADLFPTGFETATVGKVPRGWRVRYLLELCDFEYGKPLKDADRAGGPVPVYGSNGIVGWHDQSLVRGPGIIVGRKGTAGTVTWAAIDFFPIDTTFWIRPKPGAPPLSFLFLLLKTMKLERLTADSAVPGLNRNAAYSQLTVSPTPGVLEQYEKVVMPLFALIHRNALETKTLSQLRDTLLPELLQGRLIATVKE
jgi:type I restriction enzyme S subunit